MVLTINGIPGSGKNVLATHLALKHYHRENSFLRRVIRRITRREPRVNNIYSSYPILLRRGSRLKKRPPVYSNRVTIFDLIPQNRFLPHSLIIIDETQAFYDSEEYKEFPKEIAVFNQFHRHFGIDNIFYITQHPSRLLKKLRILCSEFDKVKLFIKIPIINLGIMAVSKYFEFEDYGKFSHPKKEAKTYDVKNKLFIFFVKKVFKAYDSTYMRVLNENSPLYNKGQFISLNMSQAEINYIFRDKI